MALQVTSGSQREKWIATFIPATGLLLIGFLYITFWAMPAFDKAEKEYESAVKASPALGLVQTLRNNEQRLRDEQAELRRTIRSFDDEVTKKSEEFQESSPTARHREVIALCQDNHIAVLQDQTVDSLDLPALRSKSVATLQTLIAKNKTSFRELTVAGSYANIVKLLKQLPEKANVIPVSVRLKKLKDGDDQKPSISWTLGLLI